MKKRIFKKSFFLLLSLFSMTFFVGCQDDDATIGPIITPSNIQIDVDIEGADDENPNGNGSGVVNFVATADNVISFHYEFNGETTVAPGGKQTYNFSELGVNTYSVTVIAYGTTAVSATKTIEVEVLATYQPPSDLLEMLHGTDSRTWRLKAESSGHFGVGPADALDPIWWAAAPFEKDGLGAYDDRWVFRSDGTYTHETNGTAFGQKGPMDLDIGTPSISPNGNNEYENYPLEAYSGTFSLTAPGGQETLSLSGIGYHGFYVGGDHKYKIISRSADEMKLATIGADGISWFAILIAE